MRNFKRFILIALSFLFFYGQTSAAAQTGFIAYAYDYQIAGCAYDTANPAAKIQVHVYPEAGGPGVVGTAGYSCPWSSDPNFQGHGFIIQYRRPVNSPYNINVALLDSNNSNPVWINSNNASNHVNSFNRSVDTLLYSTPKYSIGISRRFGAAVSEFYNKRVDGTVNLVYSDPGSMVQTALFGTAPAFGGATNCVGNGDMRYNPTQSGTHCSSGNVPFGSSVDMCSSSGGNSLCYATVVNDTAPSDTNPAWVQYRVRYRNFYNVTGYNGSYMPFEDVYGWVKYSFKASFVQVDYQMWKTNSTTYGVTFQQLPVAFLTQLSKVTTDRASIIRNPNTTLDYNSASTSGQPSMQYTFGNGFGRWFLAEAVNNRPAAPLMSPGNFLTLAFYSAVISNGNSICPTRYFEADFEGAGASGANNWVGVQNALHVQNYSIFQPAMFQYEQSRALLIPHKPWDGYGGSTFANQIGTLESAGGWMPSWECNQ